MNWARASDQTTSSPYTDLGNLQERETERVHLNFSINPLTLCASDQRRGTCQHDFTWFSRAAWLLFIPTYFVICWELPYFLKCFEGHKKSLFFTFDWEEMSGELLKKKRRLLFYLHIHPTPCCTSPNNFYQRQHIYYEGSQKEYVIIAAMSHGMKSNIFQIRGYPTKIKNHRQNCLNHCNY